MGAAASTEHGATVQQYRSSVLNGKPLDASDVKVCYYSNFEQIQLGNNPPLLFQIAYTLHLRFEI